MLMSLWENGFSRILPVCTCGCVNWYLLEGFSSYALYLSKYKMHWAIQESSPPTWDPLNRNRTATSKWLNRKQRCFHLPQEKWSQSAPNKASLKRNIFLKNLQSSRTRECRKGNISVAARPVKADRAGSKLFYRPLSSHIQTQTQIELLNNRPTRSYLNYNNQLIAPRKVGIASN